MSLRNLKRIRIMNSQTKDVIKLIKKIKKGKVKIGKSNSTN